MLGNGRGIVDDITESIMLDVVETPVSLKDTETLALAVVDVNILDVCTTIVILDVVEILQLGVAAVLRVVEILDVGVTLAVGDVGGVRDVVSAGGQSLADSAIIIRSVIIIL